MTTKNPIQVADKLFNVLEALSENGPSSLSDLSKLLLLNKTTTFRILSSLIYMGYAKQDPENSKYYLTFKICNIANQMIEKIDIVKIARPYIEDLVNSTGETVHLVEIDGIHAIYIDKIESSTNSIRMVSKVGRTVPLISSAVGKALLCEMDDSKISDIWNSSDIIRHTNHTITTYDNFIKEIELTRKRGYALDNEENEVGVRCIAVSFKDHSKEPKYALSISAPISRMSDDKINELSEYILHIKEKLSKELL